MSKEHVVKGLHLQRIANKAATGNNEAVSADGGALVQQAVYAGVVETIRNGGRLASRAQLVTSNSIGIKVPFSKTPSSDSPSSGTRAYWAEEAAQATISKPQLGAASLRPGKLVVRVPVTDELLNDVDYLSSYIERESVKAALYKIERCMLLGNQVAVHGVAGDGDGATVSVTVADTPTLANLKSMVAALNPDAYEGAEWYVSPQVYAGIVDNEADHTSYIQFENGRYWILGFPVRCMPQLGDPPNHIVLGDFTRYVLQLREPDFSQSGDLRFDFDETEFRLCQRAAGNAAAATMGLDDGETYGFFVVPDTAEANQSSSSSSASSRSSASSLTSASSLSSASSVSSASSPTSESSDNSQSSASSATSESSASSDSTNSSESSSSLD